MHLIQDKAVPAHVRNDGHLFKDPYEIYVEMHHLDLFQNKPVEYDGSLGSGTDAPRQLWDSDQYDGSNPMITLIPNIGLSEFTNANFLSKDTIFTENNLSDLFPLNDHHAFPYPRLDNTALYTEPTSETWNELPVLHRYFEKTGAGVSVKHFARGGRLVGPMCVFGAPPPSVITLDDKCHADYAALLLPRAVGYSAALLQYFFRIDIALAAPPEHPGKLALKNNTDEELKGTFTVYAEDAAGNRWPLSQDGSWTLTVPARGEVLLTPFLPPLPAPVRYLLVFRGRSGAEDNAVAAGPVTLAEAPLSVVGRTSRQLYEVTNSGSVALDGTLRLDYLGLDGQRHTAADGVWPLALAPGKSLEVAPFTPPDDARVVDEYQLVFSGRVAGESSGLLTRMAVVPPIGRGWFEEWDGNTLRTNHPWLTTGQELLRQNQDNGSTANRVEGSLLVKENLRGAGSTAARVNQTWIGEAWPGTGGTFCMTEYNEFCQPDDFGIEFPLPISADTMVRVKIDELTQSEPIPKPTCATTTPGIGAYQGLILTFDNGMRVAFTVPGQEPPNSWLTYVTPGRELSFNLLTEFARVGIDVSRPLQLMSINLSQQLGGLCSPAVNDQWQRMAVDYLHFEE